MKKSRRGRLRRREHVGAISLNTVIAREKSV